MSIYSFTQEEIINLTTSLTCVLMASKFNLPVTDVTEKKRIELVKLLLKISPTAKAEIYL